MRSNGPPSGNPFAVSAHIADDFDLRYELRRAHQAVLLISTEPSKNIGGSFVAPMPPPPVPNTSETITKRIAWDPYPDAYSYFTAAGE